MYHDNHPDGSYQMANRVLVFEPPRVISSKPGYVSPATGKLEFGGWNLALRPDPARYRQDQGRTLL